MILKSVAFLAGLLAAQPALAQSAEADRDAVQAAYVAGDLDTAAAILARLLVQAPNDPDLLRRLANVQAAQGDLPDARRTIDRALWLAPTDPDIQLARANILAWQGRTDEARAQADAVAVAQTDYPGLTETRAIIARKASVGGVRLLGAGGSVALSRVSFPGGVRDSWEMASGSLVVSLAPRVRMALEVERERRNADDTRIALRGELLTGPRGNLFVSGSVTPDPDFRERWSLRAGGEQQLGATTMILFDGRYAAYRDTGVVVVGLGLRQALSPDWALTARTINLFGGGEDYRIGGAVRLDWAPEDGLATYLAAASYPDTEAGDTRQLRALGTGLTVPIGPRLRLRLDAAHERRDDSYERASVALGIVWTLGPR